MPVAPTTPPSKTSAATSASATTVDGGAESTSGAGRRERKVIETRRSILVAARQLFEADGYAETTVERIAEAADVAPRTFFRYFPTKESLLFADFDAVRREMLARLTQRPTDEDPLDSLAAALQWMAGEIEQHADDISWGFRICTEQIGDGVYEKTLLREDSNTRIATFIADRLGVDEELDPRPMAWSMAVMGVFSAAMRTASARVHEGLPGNGVAIFDELLTSTAGALRATSASLPD
ncbi:MAG: TetR/AcrR family transcriptional regulator [Microthrixaceae bacterium]